LRINLNEILYAVSFGLDSVEHELTGTKMGHSKRVTALAVMTGKALGLSDKELIDLAAYSILHDHAYTEVNQEELEYKRYNNGEGYAKRDFDIRHCIIGESNTKYVPFRTNNRDVILLHHENADGSGPFGKTSQRTPIKAQLIHMADLIEQEFELNMSDTNTLGGILYFVKSNTGTLFSHEVADAFTKNFKQKQLSQLTFSNIDTYLRKVIKNYDDEYSFSEVRNLATLLARIVDFKSHYTCRHSIGVAENAESLALCYQFPEDKTTKFYLAGALHDIGKLMIPNAILQKPARLDEYEYEQMKNHAYYTYDILRKIKGMDDIMVWASHHHEKLDGSGYPFGLTADQLSIEERMMTCADIYQALTEERSYKEGFEHSKAITIMRDMAMKGEIDYNVVNNVDMIFSRRGTFRDAATTVLNS